MKVDHKHLSYLEREVKIRKAEINVRLAMALSTRTEERKYYWMQRAQESESRMLIALEMLRKHRGDV